MRVPVRGALAVAFAIAVGFAEALARPGGPPAAAQQESGEEAFRLGQEQLAAGIYGEAARTFRRLRAEDPNGSRAASAAYWEAFALYRLGNRENLERARRLLANLPEGAPTDAAALASRIRIRLGADAPRLPPCDAGDGSWFGEAVLGPWTEATAQAAASALGDPTCPAVARRSAVLALGRRGGTESFATLRQAAASDRDPLVRGDAIAWLEEDPSPETVRVVASVVRHTDDPVLGQRAAGVLPRLSPPASEEAFYGLLRDRRIPGDRRQVMLSQAALRGRFSVSVDSVRAAFEDLRDGSLQSTALEVAHALGDPDDREWIWSVALRESSPALARLTAVQRVGAERSVRELVALYGSAGARLVRYGVIQQLGSRQGAEATRALQAIAASARSGTERAAAEEALEGRHLGDK